MCFTEKVNYIVHAASSADSRMYLSNPVQTLLPNTVGTWRLLELAKADSAEGFLFFSSASAYGKVTGKDIITENDDGYIHPGDVRSCYGESKRMGENMCASYAHQYHVPACSVRMSHTYGPTMDLCSDSRVFAEFISNILYNENIEMKSDGMAKRAFCYLSDATTAFFLLLLTGMPGDVYNMCNSECFTSIYELAELLVSMYPDKGLQVVRKNRNADDSYAENKNANCVINSNNKLKDLGWRPRIGLREGFARTITAFSESQV